VLYDLIHCSRIRKHAEKLLKLAPIPCDNAIVTSVLHEFPVQPAQAKYQKGEISF
jgi:hypothetical protein